jgi:hypothetical protein
MQPAPLHQNLLRHLLRPARGGAAAVVVIFAILMALASKAIWFTGLPLALILSSWFFKYAYILFDHTSRGFDDPPVLDISMVNPIDEQRPAGQVLILCLLIALVVLTYTYVNVFVAATLALTILFFLPASIAILGLEGNILKAAYPVAWMHMIHGLGPLYPVVLALIAVEFTLMVLLGKLHLWLSIEIAIGMFAVLSIFSLLGGALYERRHEMGLETWKSPERTQERERKEELRENEGLVTEAYGLMRADSHVKAWELLQSWLTTHGHTPENYAWLCEYVHNWGDRRYITRLTEEHIGHLLILRRNGEALDVVSKRLTIDAAFRPKSAADTLAIAQLAARGGGSPRVARILLADFAQRCAGDPRVPIAEALAQHLGAATH